MAQTLLEQYRTDQGNISMYLDDDHSDCGCGCGGGCGGGTTTTAMAKTAKSTDKSVETSGGLAIFIPLWSIILVVLVAVGLFIYFRFFHKKVMGG